MKTPLIGKNAKCSCTVNSSNTAAAVSSGSLDVFGTPMMIALMEKASCQCIKEYLESGETTVGTQINVEHLAPTVTGKKVEAMAVLTAANGKKITFSVSAADESGDIGRGEITRFVVEEEKFMAKAENR